jgi:Plant mobile domain
MADAGASTSGGAQHRLLAQGPYDPSLLYLQYRHRSASVFQGYVPERMYVDRADVQHWAWLDVEHAGIWYYLRQLGFDMFCRVGMIHVDHGLVTALIERYRPETHTFHLPIGEVMIGLEDVEGLFGLRVDGRAVQGYPRDRRPADVEAFLVQELGLGPADERGYFRSQRLYLSYLKHRLLLASTGTEVDLQQRARCYVLLFMGGMLFSDRRHTTVAMDLVYWVCDGECDQMSWGSAVLAYLLRRLCKAAVSSDTASGGLACAGATPLLQLWAWEHILPLRPMMDTVYVLVDQDTPRGHWY